MGLEAFLIGTGQWDHSCYKLTKEFKIGRSRENDLAIIIDGSISREHVKITKEKGGYFIEDLGSLGGTYVNGEKIGEDSSHLFSYDDNREKHKKLNKGKIKLNDKDVIVLSPLIRGEDWCRYVFTYDKNIKLEKVKYNPRESEEIFKIKSALLQASQQNEIYDAEIKGILVREDLYDKFYRANPSFKGTAKLRSGKEIEEFYLVPIADYHLRDLGLKDWGPHGILFCREEKSELMDKIKPN